MELIRAKKNNHHQSHWVLNDMDLTSLIFILRGTWLFDSTLDAQRLKSGLEELLSYYPHLAGRMVKGKKVALNNKGVPFIEDTEPTLSIEAIEANHGLAERLAERPLKGHIKRGKQAGMTVKLTRLKNGSALSVCCSHALLDGNSFYTMVSNWSRLCSGRPIVQPVLDQSLLKTPPKRHKSEIKKSASSLGWNKLSLFKVALTMPKLIFGALCERTEPIEFSPKALKNLRKSATNGHATDTLSNNDILSAHLAKVCATLFGHSKGTKINQAIVIDLRERLPEIPEGFVGNAAFVVKGAEFSVGTPLSVVAKRNHEQLKPFLKRPSSALPVEVTTGLEVMRHKLLWAPYDFTQMLSDRATLYYINNFSKLPIYDVDFGKPNEPKTPVRAIPHNLPDPVLIWPAPPSKGGVEIYLTGLAAKVAKKKATVDSWWQEQLRLCNSE